MVVARVRQYIVAAVFTMVVRVRFGVAIRECVCLSSVSLFGMDSGGGGGGGGRGGGGGGHGVSVIVVVKLGVV